jgi:hypothetical protein
LSMEPVIRVYFVLLFFCFRFENLSPPHTFSSIPKSCPSPTFRSTHTPLTVIANWPMKAISMGYQDMLLALELYSEFSDLNTRNREPLFDMVFPRDALSWRCSVMNFYIQRFVRTKFDIYVFITWPWVDTSALGLLVLDGIILPALGALALTWFIIDIFFIESSSS